MVFNDPFAGEEVDVPHPYAAAVAGLLYGIVKAATKDSEYINVAALALWKQMAEGGDGGGKH